MDSQTENSTDLYDLDTQELNMSLLANKAKMKDDDEEQYETSIEATPAFEALDDNVKPEIIDNNQLEIQELDEEKTPDIDTDADVIISEESESSTSANIPANPLPAIINSLGTSSPKMSPKENKSYSPREERKRKHELLYKIKALAKKGIAEPFAVDMSASLEDIELVYEEMYASYQRKNSVALQRKMLVMAATLVEFLNNRYDPCDFKLDGWSASVYDSINNDEYDEVLEELYEKYKAKSKMAPEMKLLMMLGGSAFMHHTLSCAFKAPTRSAKPPMQTNQAPKQDMSGPSGLDDILRDFKNN